MRQITFACHPSFEKFARTRRREEFLSAMEVIVPWSELEALIEPHYPRQARDASLSGSASCCAFTSFSIGSTCRVLASLSTAWRAVVWCAFRAQSDVLTREYLALGTC